MFNEEVKPEIKTTSPLAEELKSEFRKEMEYAADEENGENKETLPKPKMENAPKIPFDQIASKWFNAENALLLSMVTKNHPDFIKEAAREAINSDPSEVNNLAQLIEALADRYAPTLLQSKNGAIWTLVALHAGSLGHRYMTVNAFIGNIKEK